MTERAWRPLRPGVLGMESTSVRIEYRDHEFVVMCGDREIRRGKVLEYTKLRACQHYAELEEMGVAD